MANFTEKKDIRLFSLLARHSTVMGNGYCVNFPSYLVLFVSETYVYVTGNLSGGNDSTVKPS